MRGGDASRALAARGFVPHEAVGRAVRVELRAGEAGQARFGALLGVEFFDGHAVEAHDGDEAEVVLLVHLVVEGDVPVALDRLDVHGVRLVGWQGDERGQLPAAAGHFGVAGGDDHVAAGGADAECGAFHGSSRSGIDGQAAVEQRFHGSSQAFGQAGQKLDVGAAASSFP